MRIDAALASGRKDWRPSRWWQVATRVRVSVGGRISASVLMRIVPSVRGLWRGGGGIVPDVSALTRGVNPEV